MSISAAKIGHDGFKEKKRTQSWVSCSEAIYMVIVEGGDYIW